LDENNLQQQSKVMTETYSFLRDAVGRRRWKTSSRIGLPSLSVASAMGQKRGGGTAFSFLMQTGFKSSDFRISVFVASLWIS
jgi:hypothetical protein